MTEISLNTYQTLTQKQLQDFNVSRGLARCANEPKAKTLLKTCDILEHCVIQLDIDAPKRHKYPTGKTKGDLIAHIDAFFRKDDDIL